VMWQHGDTATWIRQGSCDERGETRECRQVAMSPPDLFRWAPALYPPGYSF
jgi:hypothetical protein